MKTVKPVKSAKDEDGTREEAQAMIGSVLPKTGSRIWRTEQAMKKQLDDDTGSKAGNLWKQTVHIVDKSDDANSKVLSSFSGGQSSSATPVSAHHGPHHAKAGAEHRLRTKSMTMKQRLEAQLNAKVFCLSRSLPAMLTVTIHSVNELGGWGMKEKMGGEEQTVVKTRAGGQVTAF